MSDEVEDSDDDEVLDTLLHPEGMDDRVHGFCIGHDMDLLEEVYDDKNYVYNMVDDDMANVHDDEVLDKFCNVVGGLVHMDLYDE